MDQKDQKREKTRILVRNPITKRIAQDYYWNKIGDYLVQIRTLMQGGEVTYFIQARLPKEHREWIACVVQDNRFKELVRRNIEQVILKGNFGNQSFLRLIWNEHGLNFETDNASLYVNQTVGENDFYIHCDARGFEPANIIFLALSIYLCELYPELERWETKHPEKETNLSLLETQEIKLRKIENNFEIEENKSKEKFSECRALMVI